MTILVFIRDLSYRVMKVLDSNLEPILGGLFSLIANTANKALEKEAIYTLKTLAKYSSDVKMLYYLGLMPDQMYTKYKFGCAHCINNIMAKDGLNLISLGEGVLETLVERICDMFGDADQRIQDLGEESLSNVWRRMAQRGRGGELLEIVKRKSSKKRGEQIARFLKLNFPEVTPAADEVLFRDTGQSVFAKVGMKAMAGTPIQNLSQELGLSMGMNLEIPPAIFQPKFSPPAHAPESTAHSKQATARTPVPTGYVRRRNHETQERLVDEINQL